jgi:hypothetical protein
MKVRFRCDPALEAVLPKPFPARRGLPDWLKAMPMTAHSAMHDAEIRTVKQCPPFVDAMMAGFLIPLPCEVRYADGAFDWNWPIPAPSVPGHARAPLSFHAAAQVTGTPLADGTTNLIKFTSFWTIELPPGWSLLATHPVLLAGCDPTCLVSCLPACRSPNASRCAGHRSSWNSTRCPVPLPRPMPRSGSAF